MLRSPRLLSFLPRVLTSIAVRSLKLRSLRRNLIILFRFYIRISLLVLVRCECRCILIVWKIMRRQFHLLGMSRCTSCLELKGRSSHVSLILNILLLLILSRRWHTHLWSRALSNTRLEGLWWLLRYRPSTSHCFYFLNLKILDRFSLIAFTKSLVFFINIQN